MEVEQVAEAAAVARPHKVKGECLYCFVTLNEGEKFTDELVVAMKNKGNWNIFSRLSYTAKLFVFFFFFGMLDLTL